MPASGSAPSPAEDAHETVATAHRAADDVAVAILRIKKLAIAVALAAGALLTALVVVIVIFLVQFHDSQAASHETGQQIEHTVTGHDSLLKSTLGAACELIEHSDLTVPKGCLTLKVSSQ